MPSRKKPPMSSGAAETPAPLKSGDERGAKERPSLKEHGLATSGASSDAICPFATFTEWASDADEAAYADL